MRTVWLVTSSRADWGIQRCIAEALRAEALRAEALRACEDVELRIIACGMHFSKISGHTVDEIVADGFDVAHRVDFLQAGDTPESIGASMGEGVTAFARLFASCKPDLLTVLGDRFDMFPAAVAATPHLIPIAHLHGGEVTLGAIDDALRHAMTKLSHLHLCATEAYARRIRQMGEPAENVHVVGAPGLDDILKIEPCADAQLEADFGFTPGGRNLLVVYHPETRAYRDTPRDVLEVLGAIEAEQGAVVIVRPNADTAHRAIHDAIDALCAKRPQTVAPANLDRRTFLSLMRRADVMVGNSSSGIIEAPSFATPVVNIGQRQTGRVQAANIIDCPPQREAILSAMKRARSAPFKQSLVNLKNPYGDGRSAPRIAKILATARLDNALLLKPFVDRP